MYDIFQELSPVLHGPSALWPTPVLLAILFVTIWGLALTYTKSKKAGEKPQAYTMLTGTASIVSFALAVPIVLTAMDHYQHVARQSAYLESLQKFIEKDDYSDVSIFNFDPERVTVSHYTDNFQPDPEQQRRENAARRVWKRSNPDKPFPEFKDWTGVINITRIDNADNENSPPIAYCVYSDGAYLDTYTILGWLPKDPRVQFVHDLCAPTYNPENTPALPS